MDFVILIPRTPLLHKTKSFPLFLLACLPCAEETLCWILDVCRNCVHNSSQEITKRCSNQKEAIMWRQGGRVIKLSCNLRYEINPFYNIGGDSPAPSPPPTTNTMISDGSEGSKSSLTRIVIIMIITTVFVVALISVIYFFSRRRKAKDEPEDVVHVDEISTVESLQMEFGTLTTATNNFSDANKLGEGGFGVVYKAIKLFLFHQFEKFYPDS